MAIIKVARHRGEGLSSLGFNVHAHDSGTMSLEIEVFARPIGYHSSHTHMSAAEARALAAALTECANALEPVAVEQVPA